jgi:hypothetical protein
MWLARLRRHYVDDPHLCLFCGSDFVHPVEWQEASETHMWVRLRCGECGHWREDEFTDEELDRYDRRLDEATAEIAAAADRLHAEWRATEADAFAQALDRDLIDAADFAGRSAARSPIGRAPDHR